MQGGLNISAFIRAKLGYTLDKSFRFSARFFKSHAMFIVL